MANINTSIVEHNELICSNLEDLAFALRAIAESGEDTKSELSIFIEIPGQGKRKLLLLEEVNIVVTWENEVD